MKRLVTFSVFAVCALSVMGQASLVSASHPGCQPVCCVPPPPPPVEVSWCVEDPCTGCKYSVSACLPACCQCETPCLASWKHGVLGRKVLTYKFPCGECVDVVITKHGKTIVRD